MADLELRNLTKRFGSLRAVRGLDLTVADGELVTLVGPSGCGKTTTLKIIAGLESATSGSVLIDSRCVDRLPPRGRNVSMVFQDDALQPHLTIAQNLAFGLKMRGVARDEIERRVQQSAERFGLHEWLQRRPQALSGGERQRVALARALIREPVVILLDEPLSHLDAPVRVALRNELARRRREFSSATLYVTHDQMEAMALADRVAVMCAGELKQVGTPAELYRRPATRFVAEFLGSPPINVVAGKLRRASSEWYFLNDQMRLPLTTGATSDLSEEQRVWLGIRPEHLNLSAGVSSDWNGQVTMVQFTGPATIVEVTAVGKRWTVRLPGDHTVALYDEVSLHVEPHHCLLFDQETDRLIGE